MLLARRSVGAQGNTSWLRNFQSRLRPHCIPVSSGLPRGTKAQFNPLRGGVYQTRTLRRKDLAGLKLKLPAWLAVIVTGPRPTI